MAEYAVRIRVLGIDPAFANMGFAVADIEVRPHTVTIIPKSLHLVSTAGDDKKVVRKSSSNLRRAQELHAALRELCTQQRPSYAFAEIPSGAQSAVSAHALGIAIGVIACCPVPLIEVNPMEVKQAVRGVRSNKAIKKADVIAWGWKLWPQLNWRKDGRGKLLNDNEHLADALATIKAGIATPAFQNLLPALRMGMVDTLPATHRRDL